MKINDVNAFKCAAIDALLSWGNNKIDVLFKSRPATAVIAKRGLSNYVAMHNGEIDSYIRSAFMFLADEEGNIDCDSVMDLMCDMLLQMEQKSYHMGPVTAKIGAGEVVFELPHNFLLDMLTGNLGVIKFNKEDFLELKNYF